jgi:hypothetical protein
LLRGSPGKLGDPLFMSPTLIDSPELYDALVSDIQNRIRHLNTYGITENYLLISLNAQVPHSGDPATDATTVEALRSASTAAQELGCRGVALDLNAQGDWFRYAWNRYSTDGTAPADRARHVRQFGKQLVRAWAESIPPGVPLPILVDTPVQAGALWLPFFEGMVSGLNAQSGPALQVFLPTDATAPNELATVRPRFERLLALHFAEPALVRWQRHGRVSLGIHGPDAAPVPLTAAKLHSDTAVWIESTHELSTKSYATPIDELQPVGSHSSNIDVLRGEEGAAVLFWTGLKMQQTMIGLTAPVRVTDVLTGAEARAHPEGGSLALGPLEGPVLIEGLPARTWLHPACLSVEVDPERAATKDALPIRYRFQNRTGFAFTGVMTANAAPPFAITPDSQSLHLEPGRHADARATLRGPLRPMERATVTLRTVAGETVSPRRTIELSVPPFMQWRHRLNAPLSASPYTVGFDAKNAQNTILFTRAGELTCLDAQGELRWTRHSGAAMEASPAVFHHWSGARMLAVVDPRGTLTAVQADGNVRWAVELGGVPTIQGPVAVDLSPFPGEEIVVALESGEVVAVAANGKSVWRIKVADDPVRVAAQSNEDPDDARVWVASTGEPAELTAVDGTGEIRWHRPLPATVVDGPYAMARNGEDVLLVLMRFGQLIQLRQFDGEESDTWRNPSNSEDRFVALQPSSDPAIYVASSEGVKSLSDSLEQQWHVAIPQLTSIAAVPAHERMALVAGRADGSVWGIAEDGAIVWKDTRAVGAVTHAPVLIDLEGDGGVHCVYGAEDGVVRAVVLD